MKRLGSTEPLFWIVAQGKHAWVCIPCGIKTSRPFWSGAIVCAGIGLLLLRASTIGLSLVVWKMDTSIRVGNR